MTTSGVHRVMDTDRRIEIFRDAGLGPGEAWRAIGGPARDGEPAWADVRDLMSAQCLAAELREANRDCREKPCEPPGPVKVRKCLKCREEFETDVMFVCDPCKKKEDWW